jgi:hypothetical protein
MRECFFYRIVHCKREERRKKKEERRKKEEGRRKKEEGRKKKEERRKKKEERRKKKNSTCRWYVDRLYPFFINIQEVIANY